MPGSGARPESRLWRCWGRLASPRPPSTTSSCARGVSTGSASGRPTDGEILNRWFINAGPGSIRSVELTVNGSGRIQRMKSEQHSRQPSSSTDYETRRFRDGPRHRPCRSCRRGGERCRRDRPIVADLPRRGGQDGFHPRRDLRARVASDGPRRGRHRGPAAGDASVPVSGGQDALDANRKLHRWTQHWT